MQPRGGSDKRNPTDVNLQWINRIFGIHTAALAAALECSTFVPDLSRAS